VLDCNQRENVKFNGPRKLGELRRCSTNLEIERRLSFRGGPGPQSIPEAKFLDVNGTYLLRVFLLAIHSKL
jgi:hypothetical protein